MTPAAPYAPRQARALYAGAFAWGLAEATLFFVVPDMLLTWIALRDRRRALIACLAALPGAILGGAIMAVLGHAHPMAMHAWLDRVPAVSSPLIDTTRAAMEQRGALAMLIGPFTGVPYKLFAAQALDTGMRLPELLAWTIPARLPCFVALVLASHAAAAWLRPRLRRGAVPAIWAAAWVVNYALYWSIMPS